jgi:hypothetical protein
MLHKAKTLNGYKLDGLDGEIGKVSEFYFDDHYWVVRYLVANTGTWLSGRHVLLSPYALGVVSEEAHRVAINLTKKQIEDSPSLDSDKPVSRQFEASFYGYYGWPPYSVGPYMWGAYPYIARDPMKWAIDAAKEKEKTWDPHLRSTYDVGGHHVQAEDGEIGHVDDFVIDDENWAIRYLIIDTRNWWPGKRVLVSPRWIERVSWNESTVFVRLSRNAIKRSPEYTEESLLSRDYEEALHRHYNRRGYWTDETAARAQFP